MPKTGVETAATDDPVGNAKRRRTSDHEPEEAAGSDPAADDDDEAPLLRAVASAPSEGNTPSVGSRIGATGHSGSRPSGGTTVAGEEGAPSPPLLAAGHDSRAERSTGSGSGNSAIPAGVNHGKQGLPLTKPLADSDAESDLSSDEAGALVAKDGKSNVASSSVVQSEAGTKGGAEAAFPKAKLATAEGEADEADGDSDEASSDSESSSAESSSSSSSSESESAVGAVEPPEEAEGIPEPEAVEDEETRRRRELGVLRGAQLRRDELISMLLNLPEEEAANAILRSFVRLTVQVQPAAHESCVLAEIAGIEPSPPYTVPLKGDRGVDARTVAVHLKCKRGSSTRLIKISSVSNRDATEAEFEQWRKLTHRTGIDEGYYIEQMKQKALDIRASHKFAFDDTTVSKQLQKKPPIEFDAQKESRMRFLVQCALSQMDISGIRDYESEELEARYQDALKALHRQEEKSTKTQEEWFEKRPSLFSLKMINQKNVQRQIRDDRHALKYALETEASGSAGLNPFERRPCRPLRAWDTKLTEVAGLKSAKPAEAPKSIGDTAQAQQQSDLNGASAGDLHIAQAPGQRLSRVDRVMQAHRQANLLSHLGSLLTAQAA